MASRDFENNQSKFIQTRKEEQSPVFEVISNLDVIVPGHELLVRVDARRSVDEILTDITNDVDIIESTSGQGGEGEDTLNFDIELERDGSNTPDTGDFIAGEDIVSAVLNVTSGEIVETKVRWIVTMDNWESGKPNIQDFTGE